MTTILSDDSVPSLEQAFGHKSTCNVWVETPESFHLDRDRKCTCKPSPGTVVNVSKQRWRRTAYLRIKAGPQRDRYVHELIMEGMLGRELLPGEQVDHKDGDTLNNRWDNLVLTTDTEHTKTELARRRARHQEEGTTNA